MRCLGSRTGISWPRIFQICPSMIRPSSVPRRRLSWRVGLKLPRKRRTPGSRTRKVRSSVRWPAEWCWPTPAGFWGNTAVRASRCQSRRLRQTPAAEQCSVMPGTPSSVITPGWTALRQSGGKQLGARSVDLGRARYPPNGPRWCLIRKWLGVFWPILAVPPLGMRCTRANRF